MGTNLISLTSVTSLTNQNMRFNTGTSSNQLQNNKQSFNIHGSERAHLDKNTFQMNVDSKLSSGHKYKINNADLSKSDIGLPNVDNTSDSAKPVSTAQQTALN